MRIALVVIDPQNDFCANDTNPFGLPKGSLYVDGAQEDMDRLAAFTEDVSPHLDAIHITLDQHHDLDIAHGLWFSDESGNPAPPLTVMTYDATEDTFVGLLFPDYKNSRKFRTRKLGLIPWTAAMTGGKPMSFHSYTAWYIQNLAQKGRYAHVIWPEHCRIGTPGACVYPAFLQVATKWARENARTLTFVSKGSNPFTEHFSAVQAEVPLPNDPGTQLNAGWVATLEQMDKVFLAGEALSHCVANTGRDTVNAFSSGDHVKKIVVLSDCMSNVPSFEAQGTDFLNWMKTQGASVMTTTEAKALLR